jgi:hypothetical protein
MTDMIRYEVAKMEMSAYKDAPYFIVKSEVIKQKRRHSIMAGRYPTPEAATARITKLENAAPAT